MNVLVRSGFDGNVSNQCGAISSKRKTINNLNIPEKTFEAFAYNYSFTVSPRVALWDLPIICIWCALFIKPHLL